jgi:hypothetical protein
VKAHRLTGNNFRLRCHRFHGESEAGLQDPIQLPALLVHDRVARQTCQPAAQSEQRGDAGSRILSIELRDDFVGKASDLRSAGHAPPRSVDTVQDVFAGRLAREQAK